MITYKDIEARLSGVEIVAGDIIWRDQSGKHRHVGKLVDGDPVLTAEGDDLMAEAPPPPAPPPPAPAPTPAPAAKAAPAPTRRTNVG